MKILRTFILIPIIILSFATVCSAGDFIKIHFINLKEGESILIQTQNNNALIDSGSLLSGYQLLDYLKKNKVDRIKYLILTHPDPDHISGVFFILPKLPVDEVYDNSQVLNMDDDIYRWYQNLVRTKINYYTLKQGDILKIDNNVDLLVLWPKRPDAPSFNTNSLVIMNRFNNFNCLLTGDLDNPGEGRLIKEGLPLKANILKIGHHGYSDATSKEFLDAVSPKFAIISLDPNNKEGAPSCQTLDLLKERNIKIYRTDKDGNIVFTINSDGSYNIRTGN